jgi:hypothetical protein
LCRLARHDEGCQLARDAEQMMRNVLLPTHRWRAELELFLSRCC